MNIMIAAFVCALATVVFLVANTCRIELASKRGLRNRRMTKREIADRKSFPVRMGVECGAGWIR